MSEQPEKQPKPIGHFAMVDEPSVAKVAKETDADTTAVYLVQALGTDGTGLRSSWGREACRKRLGVRWSLPDRCTRRLEALGMETCRDKSSRIVNVDFKLVETRLMQEGYHAGLERARNAIAPSTPDHFFITSTISETKFAESSTQSVNLPLYAEENGGW